ncbi:MAG: cytochrome P450 [Bauldia sp.]|nr:cytochrome P450 [Bauldia sp.]
MTAMETSATGGLAASGGPVGAPGSGFDPQALQPEPGTKAKITSWFLANLPVFLRLMRRFWPIARLPGTGLTFITRYDDVQEVLGADEAFPVLFGDKVKELNGGPNFVLGMAESPEYRAIQRQVMRAFRREDIAAIVTPMAARLATGIVEAADGRLDAIEDLITLVPTRICEDYYGIVLEPEQRVPFSQWTFAMSMYMFADPFDDPRARPPAVAGAEALRAIVDASIAKAKASPAADTVIARLLAMPDGPDDETIRTYLVGMIAGFVPTNTMAAGNMLEIMLQRPEFLEKAQAAARAGDDALLWRCLFEASRFKPINPGPFRRCGEDTVVAKGTRRAKTIRKGEVLLVSTWSAMFDERRVADPWRFNPGRPATDYMIFGHGLHWCLGALIAEAQITQTMKALLVQDNLRRAEGVDGTLRHLGSFPQHLVVTFDRRTPDP